MKLIINKQAGFTLIELLVVVAIIGVLASVVLTGLNSARAKARDATRLSNFRQIALALELYRESSSTYTYPYPPAPFFIDINGCNSSYPDMSSFISAYLPGNLADPTGYCNQYQGLSNGNVYIMGFFTETSSLAQKSPLSGPEASAMGGSFSWLSFCRINMYCVKNP